MNPSDFDNTTPEKPVTSITPGKPETSKGVLFGKGLLKFFPWAIGTGFVTAFGTVFTEAWNDYVGSVDKSKVKAMEKNVKDSFFKPIIAKNIEEHPDIVDNVLKEHDYASAKNKETALKLLANESYQRMHQDLELKDMPLPESQYGYIQKLISVFVYPKEPYPMTFTKDLDMENYATNTVSKYLEEKPTEDLVKANPIQKSTATLVQRSCSLWDILLKQNPELSSPSYKVTDRSQPNSSKVIDDLLNKNDENILIKRDNNSQVTWDKKKDDL